MGINLELHSSRPTRNNWRKSRATLLRSSYGHGGALADALGSLQLIGISGRLIAIDPYGDTLMNRQESAAALREIHVLKAGVAGSNPAGGTEKHLVRGPFVQRTEGPLRLQHTRHPALPPCTPGWSVGASLTRRAGVCKAKTWGCDRVNTPPGRIARHPNQC
jgi:hypothetical protein